MARRRWSVSGSLELYALRYGSSQFPRRFAFSDDHSDATIPIAWSLYALKQGGRWTVFDTGFSDPAVAAAWGITMHHDPLAMLAELGARPDQVDDLVVTHHHADHIDNVPAFSRARVRIAPAEIAADARTEQGDVAAVRRVLEDPARTTAIAGEDLICDGRVRLEVVGGHTPGSTVAHILGTRHRYVITGDECYLCANLSSRRGIGVTCDRARNEAFIARESAAGSIALPFHDPAVFEQHQQVGRDVARVM